MPFLPPPDEEMLHGHILHFVFSNPSFFEVYQVLLDIFPAYITPSLL
jgi:hypothetical protein